MAMRAIYKCKIVGLKASSDKDGNPGPGSMPNKEDAGKFITWDYTKVYVELSLNGKNSRGVATEEYRVGTHEVFNKCRDIPTPFMAEMEIEKQSTGSEEREVVVGFRPLAAVAETAFDHVSKPQAVGSEKKAA